MAAFEMKKLSTFDRLIIGASIIALIALFLPWYGASFGIYSASVSGFSTSYGWLGGLLIVLAGAYLVLVRAEVNVPRPGGSVAVLVFAASLVGTIIVALRWLTLPRGSGGVSGVATYSYGPRVGIILALIVGIGQAVLAFMEFRRSGDATPWAAKPAAATEAEPPPPPPAASS